MSNFDTEAVLAQFENSLREQGFIIDKNIIADGKIHRLRVAGDLGGKTSGAYALYLDGHPAGYIQNFKSGESGIKWKYDGKVKYDTDYKAVCKKQIEENRQKILAREQELELKYLQTADRLFAEYQAAKQVENHPYLTKKEIGAGQDIKLDKNGNLLIPLQDENGKLWSVQRITQKGDKFIGAVRTSEEKEQNLEFPAKKKGCFYTSKPLDEQDEFIICEGYATAKTLEDELKKATIMAVDAGNLLFVAEKIHNLYPGKPISIYADNDIAKNINVGLNKALEVKEKLPAVKVFSPALNKDDVEQKLSDFNDIKIKYGTLKNKIRAVSFSKKLEGNKEPERER